jgi:sugar/nucleoside kinase (ribokinase family)
MSSSSLITGMGAALVDLFADVSDPELAQIGSEKASMSLIDAARSSAMQETLSVHTHQPGGAAANTIAGIAHLGQAAGFFGKTADDALGAVFSEAFSALGVHFPVRPGAPEIAPTGHCLVLVTPDAERTMHTVLGASVTTTKDDLDADTLNQTGLLYGEGYLWDTPDARDAFLMAATQVRSQGGKVAFSLADSFCATRHHGAFSDLLESHVDILLANEAEAVALFGAEERSSIIEQIQRLGVLTAVTLGADGALIISPEQAIEVPARRVEDVVDLTGAGDQFAAGFLAALHNGATPEQAGHVGVLAASEVIRHFGPRPQADMRAPLAAHGLDFTK